MGWLVEGIHMDGVEPNLLPRPRRMSIGDGMAPAVVTESAIDVPGLPTEGYRIRIGSSGARIEAADAAGLAHARRTLDQLRRGGRHSRSRVAGSTAEPADPTRVSAADPATERHWPVCEIEDWPDFPIRGVMIDVSRDKVPTMATLESLIDQLASWKVNHVELY